MIAAAAVLVLAGTTVGAGMALAGDGGHQKAKTPSGPIGGGGSVSTKGSDSFEPNTLIQSTFRFTPDKIVVHHGQQVRWVHRDNGEDPHSVTIVSKDQLPATASEVFSCKVCRQAGKAHFAGNKLKRKVDPDGDGGLDQPGDSLLFFPGQPVSRKITAPAGTKLFYVCFIHPWMQGKIVVR
jgi:plastocyanin